jgi:hypothetical protein
VVRNDTVAEDESIIKVVSGPNSTLQERTSETKQKTGMKRKSKDAHEDEPDVAMKDAVSIVEKQKKKKKRKMAENEQVKYNDGAKSQKKSLTASSSSSSNNGKTEIKAKAKKKVQQLSASDKKSKGSKRNEIDDIFGF